MRGNFASTLKQIPCLKIKIFLAVVAIAYLWPYPPPHPPPPPEEKREEGNVYEKL